MIINQYSGVENVLIQMNNLTITIVYYIYNNSLVPQLQAIAVSI